MNKYRAVYVEWLDSTLRSKVWSSAKEILDETKNVMDTFQSIAYLINQNKHEYIFASSIHFSEKGVVGFGEVFTIPKGCVTKMIKIKI